MRFALALPGFALAVAAALVFCAREARATGSPLGSGYADAVWLPVGGNVGAATHIGEGTGFLAGAEISVIDLRSMDSDFTFVPQGIYLDALRDFQSKTWRFSVGPELVAYPAVGFDAGLVVERATSETRLGARFRYFVPSLLVTPYLGCTWLPSEAQAVLEAGALLKFPIPIVE